MEFPQEQISMTETFCMSDFKLGITDKEKFHLCIKC
jgi:hypothetical protein